MSTDPKIIKIGHRGAAGHAPENTLTSFQKALELGVDMVEFDVHVCQTGELVVIHDQKVDRTTNGRGYVRKKTLDQLKELDAGQGEKIPTVQEVLDLLDKKVQVNIELKGKGTLHPTLKMIEKNVTQHGWKYEDFIVSTRGRHTLKKLHKIKDKRGSKRSGIKIGALLAYQPFGFLKFAKKINAFSAHVHIHLVNKKLVEDAHKKGIVVYAWTANEPEDIDEMKKWGVDGIFSDFPERIK